MFRNVRPRPALLLAALLAACTTAACGQEVPTIGTTVDVRSFVPSASEQDPSRQIDGVRIQAYAGGRHVAASQRVAYTFSPPIGGTHDQVWAACNGVVYPEPVRSENMVHSLEHGAVWIAYDPDRVTGDARDALAARVEGQPYLLMSPYPGMAQPISLQSWGHQLAVTDAADPRIDQFIAALRANQYTHPEPGASCAEAGAGYFLQDDPPPFEPAPTAAQVDGSKVLPES